MPNGVVTPKRESIATQIIVLVVGIALLTANFLFVDDSADTISMALLTLGIGMALYGIVVATIRHNSQHQVPYDNEVGCYMKYRERYYDRGLVAPIVFALERGDYEAIDIMPTTNIAAVVLVEYRSKYRRAYALYEYAEDEYRPISKPHISNKE